MTSDAIREYLENAVAKFSRDLTRIERRCIESFREGHRTVSNSLFGEMSVIAEATEITLLRLQVYNRALDDFRPGGITGEALIQKCHRWMVLYGATLSNEANILGMKRNTIHRDLIDGLTDILAGDKPVPLTRHTRIVREHGKGSGWVDRDYNLLDGPQ